MSEMSLEVQRSCKATPTAPPANREAGRYADLHNPNMDTELFARLRARRVMMEKWETGDDAIQTRTKTPKSSVKRPHQPDIVCKSPLLSADLINEIERLKEICELRTKELHTVRTKLNERNLGFEAMIILVKYLTEELNAFSCPVLVVQLQDVKGQLANASKQLDDLIQMRNFLIQERERLQEKQKNELFRLHVSHQVEQQSLESRVKEEAQRKQEEVLQQLSRELNGVQLKHNEELNVLKVHHEQDVQTREESHADALARLDAQLNEKIAELNSSHEAQVEDLTKQFEDAKLCLLEKVTQLKTECDDLRSREKSYSTTYQQESEIKIQNALLPYRYLEQEVESLRVVMDLRNQELAQLRQNKREMEKQLEEIPVARETINKLQQKIENLEAIINIKVDYEKELAEKHHVLLRKYDRESKAKKRLSMDNEELVWRLSQSEVGSTPDVFRMSLSQLPTIPSGGHRDVHEPRQRPKSMVLLSPPTTPSGVGGTDKPPLYRASQSTGGVKLRRPRMFASVDHNLASDMKLSEIKQSDV